MLITVLISVACAYVLLRVLVCCRHVLLLLQNEKESLGSENLTIPALAKKVFAGLRVLHVVSNTGAMGKNPLGRETAIGAVQLANKHMSMFPEPNQAEFRGWCKGKKVRMNTRRAIVLAKVSFKLLQIPLSPC